MGRYQSEDLGIDGRIILKGLVKGRASTGLIWFRVGASCGLL